MLIKMLAKNEKRHFIDLADLLIIANQPLLWGGKTSDEITSDTDLSALSFKEEKNEIELIAELENYAGNVRENSSMFGYASSPGFAGIKKRSGLNEQTLELRQNTHIVNRLLEVLKDYPFMKMDRPETRIEASMITLKNLLEDQIYERPSTPKIILFELLLVVLRNGKISDIQLTLLKEIQRHHNVEDFIFDDLVERAEVINLETSKTISMILE